MRRVTLCVLLAAAALLMSHLYAGSYSSLRAQLGEVAATHDKNTLVGYYNWAASAATLDEALARWKDFLEKYTPREDEGYEDAIHVRLIRSANYELLRVHYLRQSFKEADKLLKEIKDSDPTFH